MSSLSRMHAQARAMMPLFETALKTADEAKVDLAKVGFAAFQERLLVPFAGHPNLRRLAVYAIEDALPLVKISAQAATDADIVGERLRATLHDSSASLLGPSWMNDAFMQHFVDRLTTDDVHIATPLSPDTLPRLSWRDFDYFFASSNSGCPAHDLPLSDTMPVNPLDTFPGVAAPKNFLDQFFRLTVDVVLTDIGALENDAVLSGGTAAQR